MRVRIPVLSLLLAVCCVLGRAQVPQKRNPHKAKPSNIRRGSGPLTWITSDLDPKTVFWIQGRFVPVDHTSRRSDAAPAEVATILCLIREDECLEIDSTTPAAHDVLVWTDEFKPVHWDKRGILASGRSVDGCTDETLKIRFSPPSVVIINSPVLPLSEGCKKINNAWDSAMDKHGSGMAAQTEEDMLVPTRGVFSFSDANYGSPENSMRPERQKR